jgi:putative ABC transport system permease protein
MIILKTLGLQIMAGRDFSKTMSTDKDHAWIINETLLNKMGIWYAEKGARTGSYWHPWGATNPDSLKTGKDHWCCKRFQL